MKKLIVLCLVMLIFIASVAMAAEQEPKSKTIEDTIVYENENVRVEINQWCYAFNNTAMRFYAADVYVNRPDQLMTAFAGEAYSKNNAEWTSSIAERHNAVLAINGDYYNYKDNIGLVIRNGVLYRDKNTTRDILLVRNDGTFIGIPMNEYKSGEGERYISEGIVQSFIFGPLLVNNGEITELPKDYVISMKETIREPRTAIGQIDQNHYLVVVADGRRKGWSDLGMSLRELQKFFYEQGATIAYNLDGGGSATMVLNGNRVNKTSGSRERNVSDIIYFTN